MSTNIQDYVELLNAEQYVQVGKLAESARHGVTPKVRGEVWMYLLRVLSADKTSEISSIINLNTQYQAIPSVLPPDLQALLTKTALAHHTRRFSHPTYANLISSLTAENPTGASLGSPAAAAGTGHSGLGASIRQPSAPFTEPSRGASDTGAHSRASTILSGTGHSRETSTRAHTREFSATSSRGSSDHPLERSEKTERERERNDRPERTSSVSRADESVTTLRSQVSRFLPPPPSGPPTRQAYLAVLMEAFGKYYSSQLAKGKDKQSRRFSSGVEDSEANWLYLATPFICCLSRPIAIYLGFEKIVERMETFPSLPSQLATLLTLFRQAVPELFSYFEDEQVSYVKIAMSWLTTLLAKELWLGDVLRLWDAYLASSDMFALHCYVCVAVLATCKETLEELDGSEAKLMLLDLPPMDVDRLLQDAANLRVSFPLPVPVNDDDT